jgi:hypothetical protein
MFKNLELEMGFGLKVPLQDRVELAKAADYQGIDLDIVETENLMKIKSCSAIAQLVTENNLRLGVGDFPPVSSVLKTATKENFRS